MNFYRALGLSPSAGDELSDKIVREAYFKLAKQYHPDTNKSPDAAVKFRHISHSYDMIKTKDRRLQLMMTHAALDDDAFGRKMRRENTNYDPDYAANYRNVESEFANAEKSWKQANKKTHRFMNAFEAFIHPRVLFFLLPATLLGYYAVSTGTKKLLQQFAEPHHQISTSVFTSTDGGGERSLEVEAWMNPSTKMWESAAPWNAQYRAAVASNSTRMMDRKNVTESKR